MRLHSCTLHLCNASPKAKMDRKPTSKRTRYPGITADARSLGVHRTTLYKMLRGTPGFAGLKTLRRRYEALKTRQAKEGV